MVDDDPAIAEVLTKYLEREGYSVETVGDGQRALDAALSNPPDIVVLDLTLPRVDGLEVCRRLRALAPIPVIMLTARGDESDRVIGLELGADDYMSKPFSPRELVSRVRAVLRRAHGPLTPPPCGSPALLIDGGLQVDVLAREVTIDGERVSLTARELELLAFLMRHPRQAFRREELLDQVWGTRYGDTSTITVHIRRIREKIEVNPSHPARITTVWGIGYRWQGTSDETPHKTGEQR